MNTLRAIFSRFRVLFLVIFWYQSKAGSIALWPAGQYGLPMPFSGCPQTNFPWKTGWRYQDTEDKTPSNSRSDDLHIEGTVGPSSVNGTFCMKIDTSNDNSLPRKWPKGKYCIYKKGQYCPQGLQSGLVIWDDEDSENTNSQSGVLPEGDYKGSSTAIQYCCSVEGTKTTPIPLPFESPFYLLAYSSIGCQQVEWALATREWIHYDTENGINNDRKYGNYPYGAKGGVDGHTIHYCYYKSCKYILNGTVGVIQSPNHPNNYPDGQLCTWRILVLSGYVIHLQFTKFSMRSPGDVVQVYDGFNDSAVLLGAYHGVRLPSDIRSSSNSLYVVFQSDGALSSLGFRADYNAIEPKADSRSSTSTILTPTESTTVPMITTKSSPASTPGISSTASNTIHSPVPIKLSCIKASSSAAHTASIVVPVICFLLCLLVAAAMACHWKKSKKEKNMKVIYQANPAYFGTKIMKNRSNNNKDDTYIAPNEKEEIYQEVIEKRIDNPLYQSQENLDSGNPIYQPTPDSTYDSIPFNSGFIGLSDY